MILNAICKKRKVTSNFILNLQGVFLVKVSFVTYYNIRKQWGIFLTNDFQTANSNAKFGNSLDLVCIWGNFLHYGRVASNFLPLWRHGYITSKKKKNINKNKLMKIFKWINKMTKKKLRERLFAKIYLNFKTDVIVLRNLFWEILFC